MYRCSSHSHTNQIWDFWCDGESHFSADVPECSSKLQLLPQKSLQCLINWTLLSCHGPSSNNIFCVLHHIHDSVCMDRSVCVTENSFDCHLSPQRPAGHPEDGVRLGDGPGAAQRPRPPRRKGSQGWLRYQSSPACGGTLEHTGLSSTALLTNPFSSAPLTSLSFYPTPPRSCTAWPKLLRVNVNQAYEAHAAPAVLCVMSKLNPSWMRR